MMKGIIIVFLSLSLVDLSDAFSPSSFSSQINIKDRTAPFRLLSLYSHDNKESTSLHNNTNKPQSKLTAASLALAIALSSTSPLAINPSISHAYDPNDYASETVTAAVQGLKNSKGDTKATFSTFESIAEIITEGKGVGGSINYSTL